jgi:hypothetical protein
MALELTNNTVRALSDLSLEPSIVLQIEGVDDIFSSGATKEYIRIGDENLFIDGTWYIGGFRELINNKQLIDSDKTSYSIRQQMNYDTNESSSISNMTVGLIDKDGAVTELITPDNATEYDILGRKAKVYLGFGTTSFNDDYLLIFQGYVTEIESNAGLISIKINHPDNKKKISLFKEFTTKLTASITGNTILTCTVEDTSGFLPEVSGLLETYAVINNEVVRYTVTSPTTLDIVRGQINTVATTHNNESEVSSLYALVGNPLDIALKIMLSGPDDFAFEDIAVSQFVQNGLEPGTIENSLFFSEKNLSRDFNIRVGDLITVSGAINGANNFTGRTITQVNATLRGTTLVVDGAPLVLELESTAVMSFKSKYAVWDQGFNMKPDDVDIEQHEFIRDFFHPATEYQLLIDKDVDNGKEFLDKQIYTPIACYGLPRKGQSSVGYSIGPIPGANIKTLNINNIKNPKGLSIGRTTARAFFNEVIYKYDKSPISDKYLKGYAIVAQDSKNRIFGSSRAYKVEADGIRTNLNGLNLIQEQAQRIVDRYKFAAESASVSALLKDSVDIEIGDVVVLEGTGLSISDISNGTRKFDPRLFEVRNKDINLKTGDVAFELLDTGQDIDTRFGLMSPVSQILSVVNQSQIVIGHLDGYPSAFGLEEWRNWQGVFDLQDGIVVRIRDAGFTFEEIAIVKNFSENIFTFDVPAATTLAVGMIIEFADYNDVAAKQKLIYASMTDAVAFDDGLEPYSMI